MRKQFYTYILQCADDSYYVGVTNDIEIRLMEHNSEHFPGSYCHSRRPVKMVFCREFDDPGYAIAFEKQLKGWSRAKKEALINKNMEALHQLAVCHNETSHLNSERRQKEMVQPDAEKFKKRGKNIKPLYPGIKRKNK